MGSRVCCCCRILNIIYFYTCKYERVSLRMILIYTMERRCGQYSVTNCRRDFYAFNLRRSMCRPSMIDVSTFEDRCADFQRSMIDVSTFEDRRSMCRLSKIGVSTFGDRCVDLRKSMIDVSIIEDRCVDLRTSMVDVQLCCYTC